MKFTKNEVDIIKSGLMALLELKLLPENGWEVNDKKIIQKLIDKDFEIEE